MTPIQLEFEKYQSSGNDFVLIDEDRIAGLTDAAREGLSRALLDRHCSVGADSILFLKREPSGIRYRIFEEGIELEMCGNGLCCAAHHVLASGEVGPQTFITKGGIRRTVTSGGGSYTVDLGPLRPIRAFLRGGADDDALMAGMAALAPEGPLAADLRRLGIRVEKGFFVNPSEAHVVFLVDDVSAVDLDRVGDRIGGLTEIFPESANVNVCEKIDDRTVRIRTYERGKFKETRACGTGSAASAYVAKAVLGLPSRTIRVRNTGGELLIRFRGERIFLTGPAVKVFSGTILVELPRR